MFHQFSSTEELYGFLDGVTATIVILFTIFFTIVVLNKSRKVKAKLLTYGALMGGCAGALWLGPCVNFIFVFFYDTPLDPIELYGILSYMWVAPALIFAMYIGAELMMPHRKKLLLIIYVTAGIIFELFLFLDMRNAFHFEMEGNYADSSFVYGHPAFLLIAFFLASVFIIVGLGSLRKALQSTGFVRKRFLYLTTSIMLFIVVGASDSLINPGPVLFVMRIGMIISAVCIYKALKPSLE
ncbi:MAG: hypothetical protein EU544_00610 [Promethearchaeota archaeon]|nr:MAG: hypothetical protein EU544_00610 [Candidatus Lokiarchaeota archaeon]